MQKQLTNNLTSFQDICEEELVRTEGGYDISQMPNRDEMCGTLWILLGGGTSTFGTFD